MINTNLPDAFQQVIGLGAQLAVYPARKSSRIGSTTLDVYFRSIFMGPVTISTLALLTLSRH